MSHDFSPEEQEARKKAIWDKMSPRRKKWVEKQGYENWDPFAEPFHPIDIRVDKTGRTAQDLAAQFFASLGVEPEPHYAATVSEFCVTLVHNSERIRPIYDFCDWYRGELEKHKKVL